MSDQILGLGEFGGQIVDTILQIRPYSCVHAIDTDVQRLRKLKNVEPENKRVILGSRINGESKYCSLEMDNVHGLDNFTASLTTLVAGADKGALFATECIFKDPNSRKWGKDRKYVIAIILESSLTENRIFKQIENVINLSSKISIIKIKPAGLTKYNEVAQNVIKLHYGPMGVK